MAPARVEVGQVVRWRQGRGWRYGQIGAGIIERDGSLRVYDDLNGGARALRLGRVQCQVRGRRGGRHWDQPLVVLAGGTAVWSGRRFDQLSLFTRQGVAA
jgi:hypothetical protein